MGLGGIVGKENNPTLNSASGVWSLREQLQNSNYWPTIDAYYDVLLMKMENTNWTDSSGNCVITASNAASISTSVVKHENGSYYANRNAFLYVYSANTGVMDFGTGDFTIECWLYRTASNERHFICDSRQNGGNAGSFFLRVDSDNKLEWSANNVANSAKSAGTVPSNEWVHLAVCRSGTDIRLFINGNVENTSSLTSSLVDGTNSTYPPILFTTGFTWGTTGVSHRGYADDLRITKAARYISNFTPPGAL